MVDEILKACNHPEPQSIQCLQGLSGVKAPSAVFFFFFFPSRR